MRALSHDPRDRYASMQKLIDALVEERFANGLREGANDLAQVIRGVAPGAGAPQSGPKTQHTDRPVTIVTRSLISQSTGKRKSLAHPVRPLPEQPDFAEGSVDVPPVLESGAQTKLLFVEPLIPPRTEATPPPVAAVTPMPQQLLAMAAAMLPAPELASVHGGNTFTGHSVEMERAAGTRWTFAVLGAAALIGAIAAVAFQIRSHEDEVETAAPIVEASPPVNKLDLDKPVLPPVAKVEAAPSAAPAPITVAQPTPKPDDKPAPSEAKSDDRPTTVETRIVSRRAHVAAAAPKLPATKADAFLQVDEWNAEYAHISIAGQAHDTPAKFYLAAGTYTFRVQNDQEAFSCRVTLGAGKALHVHVSLENRSCADR